MGASEDGVGAVTGGGVSEARVGSGAGRVAFDDGLTPSWWEPSRLVPSWSRLAGPFGFP
ncbi:hypothetical protein AB0L53_32950 [Nonomuraea sp. NPDC052129]|uniref:hypothetical protein n=1 Tax=Nonomuraea sp. NPDC052129 TaxID=3154651 RepID=UPI003448F94A